MAGVAFCVPLTRGGDCVHGKFSEWSIESLLDAHGLAPRTLFCGVVFQSFGLLMESKIIELERRRLSVSFFCRYSFASECKRVGVQSRVRSITRNSKYWRCPERVGAARRQH